MSPGCAPRSGCWPPPEPPARESAAGYACREPVGARPRESPPSGPWAAGKRRCTSNVTAKCCHCAPTQRDSSVPRAWTSFPSPRPPGTTSRARCSAGRRRHRQPVGDTSTPRAAPTAGSPGHRGRTGRPVTPKRRVLTLISIFELALRLWYQPGTLASHPAARMMNLPAQRSRREPRTNGTAHTFDSDRVKFQLSQQHSAMTTRQASG